MITRINSDKINDVNKSFFWARLSVAGILFIVSIASQARVSDFKGLPFLDENIKVGLGMTYSKLETGSTVGNYFLLSQANPRLEIQYDAAVRNSFTQRFSFHMQQLVYRPENNSLKVKYAKDFYAYGISWRPRWISDGQGFAYGLKLEGKSTAVISEIPNPFDINGDLATRYSAEAGVAIVWFGQTVAKLPMSLDFELLYTGTLADNSVLTNKDGWIYRFGIEFDFGKRSLLSNWNLRAFYSYEDIKNDWKNFVDKEVGVMINKVFFF